MSAEYYKVELYPEANPDFSGVYKTDGIYNFTNYYREMGGGSYLWYDLARFIISDTLGIKSFPYFSNQQIGVIIGIYDPQNGATGGLITSKYYPDVVRQLVNSSLSLTDNILINLTPDQMHCNLVRWCYASINKYFNDRKSNYTLYIEGDERMVQNLSEFAELRIDGPFITRPQKNLYILDVEINILCQTHNDPRSHYKAQNMVGVFASAFKNLIHVYKFGDGPLDDGSLFGCFHLSKDRRDSIDINHFGIIKQDTKIVQTTIEGHYRLELWQ